MTSQKRCIHRTQNTAEAYNIKNKKKTIWIFFSCDWNYAGPDCTDHAIQELSHVGIYLIILIVVMLVLLLILALFIYLLYLNLKNYEAKVKASREDSTLTEVSRIK